MGSVRTFKTTNLYFKIKTITFIRFPVAGSTNCYYSLGACYVDGEFYSDKIIGGDLWHSLKDSGDPVKIIEASEKVYQHIMNNGWPTMLEDLPLEDYACDI